MAPSLEDKGLAAIDKENSLTKSDAGVDFTNEKTSLIKGFAHDPDDSAKDNAFLMLYKDPTTFASSDRELYLSRHGESVFNLYGKIGGNSLLSTQGEKYAMSLGRYIDALQLDSLHIWTSELVRTQQTASHIQAFKHIFPQLNELNSGKLDGLKYEEIAESYPVEFALRDKDKLRYKYPNGESYIDVCRRLCEILPAMNQSKNLLVISHQAVVRCIVAYLLKIPIEQLPYIRIPLHTVFKITYDGSHCRNVMQSLSLNVSCVDTYRPKPPNCEQSN